MANRNLFLHYTKLVGAIALGTFLRFWHLDLKPLWLDEVITALFSLGRSYNDVPVEVVFSLDQINQLFTFNPTVRCPQIAHTLAIQSNHPPLFFCLMHSWIGTFRMDVSTEMLSWTMRSLPALFGLSAIAAVYWLNARAFSPAAGLWGAAVMAVSPFAVYLSQEARHYTLPLLLIALALLGLIEIQKDLFHRQRLRTSVLLGWAIVNCIGLYVHYFFILAFIAELGTLLGLMYWRGAGIPLSPQEPPLPPTPPYPPLSRGGQGGTGGDRGGQGGLPANPIKRNSAFAVCLAISSVVLSFMPWFPVMLSNFSRPETTWLPAPNIIAPFYQTLASWLIMVIALPVENQPLWIAVPSGLLMVLFGSWLGVLLFQGFQSLKGIFKKPYTRADIYYTKKITNLRIGLLTLLSFTVLVLLEFLAIVYLLGKDLTVVPRYNFVYYPSVCALLGASLNECQKQGARSRELEAVSGELRELLGQWELRESVHTDNLSERSPSASSASCAPPSLFFPCSLLLVGVLSCVFVVSDLAFQKPYHPQQVAQNMNLEPSVPLMVVMGYKDYQDVALGLSFGLALEKVRSDVPADFAFLTRSLGYESVWEKLSHLPTPATSKLNLWVVAPELKRRDYPPGLALSNQMSCTLDSTQHYRIGVPYQLYRCKT